MKKLAIITLILGSITYASYAASDMKCAGKAEAGSHNRFVEELQLEPERATQMEAVLGSYRDVGKLYARGQTDQIPELLAAKEAELAAILTPEEMDQFKRSIGAWASGKKFNFMKPPHNHQQL